MRKRLYIFLLVVSFLLVYTALKGMMLWPEHPLIVFALTVLLFVVMLGATFLYRFDVSVYEKKWFQTFAWTGSVAMGIWAAFILFSIPFDIVTTLFSIHPDTDAGMDILHNFSLGFLFASAGIAGLGLAGALRGPHAKDITVPVRDLDRSLEGFKIAQISDLHVGMTIRKDYVEEVVRRTNALNPDLIVVTGDLVDGDVESVTPHLQPLADLRARFGCFYVTGNHEYYWGAERLLTKIQGLGLQPLLNENRIIEIKDAKLLIGGITDPMGDRFVSGHKPDLEKAARTTQKPHFRILLAHRPNACVEAERWGFDLQLSGHTHGGQFFPFNLVVRFAHKFHRGLNKFGRMWVYVNPGTGFWGPANRFAVASEISLLQLTRKE